MLLASSQAKSPILTTGAEDIRLLIASRVIVFVAANREKTHR
jgi:hypothetical protein